MAKKQRAASAPKPAQADKPATLKDLLGAETLEKLKAQADELKAEEVRRKEEQRQQALDARKAEEKRLENDFAHLLESSEKNWRKYK